VERSERILTHSLRRTRQDVTGLTVTTPEAEVSTDGAVATGARVVLMTLS
jgi:hypothetical protein